MGSWMRNSRPLEATSRVIFELKPFEVSRGAIGSEPWVRRSNAKKTGNSTTQHSEKQEIFETSLYEIETTRTIHESFVNRLTYGYKPVEKCVP